MRKTLEITVHDALAKTVERCRRQNIIIPTLKQMMHPDLVPQKIRDRLLETGLWDFDPINLFRITWKNDPESGLYGDGNWLEFPPELTGVDARIIGVVGKYFPTGSHKVGAAFGCLVPRLTTGAFDPTTQKAVWPSTGNYCRGGAFDSLLLACDSIAILPEEMSRERFEWLSGVASEVIATPGCESNVKEIYDKCWEIRRTRPECVIFNQFDEFGNAQWHYHLTGGIVEEIFNKLARPGQRLSAWVSATGSAGTLAAGDYLKTKFPGMLISASEALQCPTLLRCGFGGHRIEGIGDKHVPWIHNVRNTDFVVAVDDEQCMSLIRLFNEPAGRATLEREGVDPGLIDALDLLGISSISNLISAIKTARYYDMDGRDVIITPLTDSMELYTSRLAELHAEHGEYSRENAIADMAGHLHSTRPDFVRELGYKDRQQLHNFKYFTWVEQQQRGVDELRELWDPDFWPEKFGEALLWDQRIKEFNDAVGLL